MCLPEGRLVLDTAVVLAATIVAILAAARFQVEGRLLDLLLAAGFCVAGIGTLAFSVVPLLGGEPQGPVEAWAALGSRLLAAVLIALAPDRARAEGLPAAARPRRRTRGRRARPARALGLAERRWVVALAARPEQRREPAVRGDADALVPRAPGSARRARLRDSLSPARRGPRQLARSRGDDDAVRRAQLRAHAKALDRRRLAGRLPARRRLRNPARRRLAGDSRRGARTGGRRGTGPRGPRDPRRARAVSLRDLDTREHARVGGRRSRGCCRS